MASSSETSSLTLPFSCRQVVKFKISEHPNFSKVLMTDKISNCCFLFHSNYLAQLRTGYERATKEETVTAASVTEPPHYHMTLMAPNPEQNNNLKSVETQ
jgi:hypothetical protein